VLEKLLSRKIFVCALVLLTDVDCQHYFFVELLLAEWALVVLFLMTSQQMLDWFEQLPETS
jgi:hypothetical protein